MHDQVIETLFEELDEGGGRSPESDIKCVMNNNKHYKVSNVST